MAGIIFVIFSNSFLVSEVQKVWEGKNPKLPVDTTFDAAIVLGGYSHWNSRHEQFQVNESAERMLYAIKMYKRGMIKKIILSGGSGSMLKPHDRESIYAKDFMINCGVYKGDILVDEFSRNTHENAVNTNELIREKWEGYGSFVLITSAMHMRRARGCFEKTDLSIFYYGVDFQVDEDDCTPLTFIVPSTSAMEAWNRLIKEVIGYGVYKVNGYL